VRGASGRAWAWACVLCCLIEQACRRRHRVWRLSLGDFSSWAVYGLYHPLSGQSFLVVNFPLLPPLFTFGEGVCCVVFASNHDVGPIDLRSKRSCSASHDCLQHFTNVSNHSQSSDDLIVAGVVCEVRLTSILRRRDQRTRRSASLLRIGRLHLENANNCLVTLFTL